MLLLVVLRDVEVDVDNELRLLLVEFNPVDNEVTPLCAVLSPVEADVDSDATLLLVVLRDVDVVVESEVTLLWAVLMPVNYHQFGASLGSKPHEFAPTARPTNVQLICADNSYGSPRELIQQGNSQL